MVGAPVAWVPRLVAAVGAPVAWVPRLVAAVGAPVAAAVGAPLMLVGAPLMAGASTTGCPPDPSAGTGPGAAPACVARASAAAAPAVPSATASATRPRVIRDRAVVGERFMMPSFKLGDGDGGPALTHGERTLAVS